MFSEGVPAPHAPHPASSVVWRLLWQLPAAAAIWLNLIEWPTPASGALDPSWQQLLVEAWLQQRQFGVDLVFTYGPWGFLFLRWYPLEGLAIKIAFEIVGKLLLAAILVELCTALAPSRRALFVGSLVVVGWLSPDAVLILVAAVLLLRWLSPEARPEQRAVGCTLLAVIALGKFSLFVFTVLGLMLVVAGNVMRRQFVAALANGVTFAAALVLLWVAAGQSIGHFPEFVRLSRDLSAGYPAAMSLNESWAMFGLGLSLLASIACSLLWLARRATLEDLAACVLIGAATALSWKGGFTRADEGHVVNFFVFGVLVALALPALLSSRLSRWAAGLSVGLAVAGLLLCRPDVVRHGVRNAYARTIANGVMLGSGGVGQMHDDFERTVQAEALQRQLPRTRAAVGAATIDLIGYEQGVLYLNRLTHRPRPVPQDYVAYTPELLRLNAEYLRSPAAPEFLLVALKPIDGRYAGQSDSLVLAELPSRYEEVLEESGYVLLRRRAEQPASAPLPMTTVLELTAFVSQEFDLPRENGYPLWLEVDASLSMAGRMRSLLYKPPQLALTIVDEDGRLATSRLIPGIMKAGALIQPTLHQQSDLVAYIRGESAGWPKTLRIDALPEERVYWSQMQVRVSRLNTQPLRRVERLLVPPHAGPARPRPTSISAAVSWVDRHADE